MPARLLIYMFMPVDIPPTPQISFSDDPSYCALIAQNVSHDLLARAHQKGASFALMFKHIQPLLSYQNLSPFVIQYEWQLLLLGCDHYDYESQAVDFWEQKDNWGSTPTHYFAFVGNIEALEWVRSNKPLLLEEKNDHGCGISHQATGSSNPKVLEWLSINLPRLLDETCKRGSTFAHYAAAYGNVFVLEWCLTNKPELLVKADNDGNTIAHYSAYRGEVISLDWIIANKPSLLDNVNHLKRTIAHLASMSNKPKGLEWILAKKAELLNALDKDGNNLAHTAAILEAGAETLDWIHHYTSHLIQLRNRKGYTISLLAAIHGNIKGLSWIAAKEPDLLETIDIHEYNIVHMAALSKDLDTFIWVSTHKPDLLEITPRFGYTFLHLAASCGNGVLIEYCLKVHPKLAKELWEYHLGDDTVESMASPQMMPKPNQILENCLLTATKHCIENEFSQKNDIVLLNSFHKKWQDLLFLKSNTLDLETLSANIASRWDMYWIRALVKKVICITKPLKELKDFIADDVPITRSHLFNLLKRVPSPTSSMSVFYKPTEHQLIQQLRKFWQKLDQETLEEKHSYCLQLIIDDYMRGMLGASTQLTDLVIQKLVVSNTLSKLRPKVVVSEGLNITVDQFPDYLKKFKERIGLLSLSDELAITIKEVIINGVEALISDEEEIIKFVTVNFGKLYKLHPKLPLHTDHTRDPEAYRRAIHALLRNFFGAIEIAHEIGRLDELCKKLSTQFCIEARFQTVFQWIHSLTDLVSFTDLMERFYCKEYLAYTEVMSKMPPISEDYIEPALNFIMERHKNDPCLVDSTYAPEGKVTAKGVKLFLTESFLLIENCSFSKWFSLIGLG